ncbi:MAG: hypothetical protein GTO02_04905 [Candidatus Dadabacteria bacterium]|nr:hypothetical protein [Candidatus Dadabacteria bacterium]
MFIHDKYKNRILFSLIVILFIISIPVQKSIDSRRNKFRSIENVLYLNSKTLKRLSLGYEELIADIYWLRALQYFGNTKFSEQDSEKLYKYFDILTDLDKKFINAYRYGATFIGEAPPLGLGDLDNAVLLLDKGRKNNPKSYRIPLEEGFLFYFYTKNYDRAAELFEESANNVDKSDIRRASIRGMAASAKLRGGKRETAKQIWKYIYDTNPNQGRKNYALLNIKELDTMDVEDSLTMIMSQFYKDYSRYPLSLNEFATYRYLEKIPKDHGDNDFIIAPRINAVKSITLAKKRLKENSGFLNARSWRFKKDFGRFPFDIAELKLYIDETSILRDYPEHPLGEEYLYDPETGRVDYDKSFLN